MNTRLYTWIWWIIYYLHSSTVFFAHWTIISRSCILSTSTISESTVTFLNWQPEHYVAISSVHQDCICNEFTLKTCVKFSDQGADLRSALSVLSTKTELSSVGASEGCGPAMILTYSQDLQDLFRSQGANSLQTQPCLCFFLLNAI